MIQFSQFEQSHMPYVTMGPDEKSHGFFCLKNALGVWKLCHTYGNGHVEVGTGLPDDWNECCPVAEYEDEVWRMSFVAGPTRVPGRYGLYRMTDFKADALERVLDADVGFARWDWLVWGSRRGPLIVKRGKNEQELHIAGLDFLYRVCPHAFAPSRLLITAAIGGVDQSIVYDFHSNECQIVTFQDACLYKFAAHPCGDYVYALRGNGDNEDRRVVQSGSVVYTPAPDLISLKKRETGDSMDCVACFRKHIAAALSFAKEIMGGHGAGADLDHRADLEGEIANAEQHAREMTVPGYAAALRELRHTLDAKAWQPGADDVVVLRKLWKSSMGVSCGCGKHRVR
ncbi:MAG: hypothetical protein WCZ46_13275 [Proteiniphilum sp.]